MERFQNLDVKDLKSNPFEQFKIWFENAKKQVSLYPEAMSLSTIDDKGYPQSRYVLLRGYKPPVFQFFTNYNSDKGQQLIQHPKACLLFYWKDLGQQIRINGDVEKSSAQDSTEYWNTRPNESKIHALASDQSQAVSNFQELLDKVQTLEKRHQGQNIERPAHWGGFNLTAQSFEFWQEGKYRLHHRFKYEKSSSGSWSIQRLNP